MNKFSRILILCAISAHAWAQTAAYPSAIATDSQLGVAANNVVTSLTGFMGASDTTFTVSSASAIVANMFLTIDGEIVHVCGKTSNTVSVGIASCPNVDGRSFDNTAAATHNVGATVSSEIDAWHHNSVKEEIKAIENALGINLGNVTALIPNPMPVNKGGTNATTQAGARTNLGAAASGSNSDITALTGLSTPMPVNEGGTNATTQAGARTNLGAAASGSNSDITALTGLSTPMPVNEGGTAATTAAGALTNLMPSGPQLGHLRIKPNVGNTTTYEFAAPATVNAADYIFAAQAPGGSLAAGSNAITLTPCPLGVAGTDSGHQLYISAGSGTAETVLITGGTCTSGAASGTIIITVANSHSGAWTVQSATGGGQEAAYATPNGAVFYGQSGTVPMYGTLTLNPPSTAQAVTCASWGTTLQAQSGTVNIINVYSASPVFIQGCSFSGAVTRTGGAYIQLGDGVTYNNYATHMDHLQMVGAYNGVYVASAYDWKLTNSQLTALNYDVLIKNLVNGDMGDSAVTGNVFQMGNSGAPAVIRWESGGGLKIANNKLVANANWGIDCMCSQPSCTGDINIVNNSIEAELVGGIRLSTTSGPFGRGSITANQIAVAAGAAAISISGLVAGAITEFEIGENDISAGNIILGAHANFIDINHNILNSGSNVLHAIETSAVTEINNTVLNNMPFGWTAGAYGGNSKVTFVDLATGNPDRAFALLPSAAADGSMLWVNGVTPGTAPCIAGSGGAIATRVGGVWSCNGPLIGALSTFPSCASGTKGLTGTVTDSAVNTWGTTITGSGASVVRAFCNGTNWTVEGK